MVGKFLSLYVATWWMPALASILSFLVAATVGLLGNYLFKRGDNSLVYVFVTFVGTIAILLWLLSVIAIPTTGIYQLMKKRVFPGIINILLGMASLALLYVLYVFSIAF